MNSIYPYLRFCNLKLHVNALPFFPLVTVPLFITVEILNRFLMVFLFFIVLEERNTAICLFYLGFNRNIDNGVI
jgi:hypothetical protein